MSGCMLFHGVPPRRGAVCDRSYCAMIPASCSASSASAFASRAILIHCRGAVSKGKQRGPQIHAGDESIRTASNCLAIGLDGLPVRTQKLAVHPEVEKRIVIPPRKINVHSDGGEIDIDRLAATVEHVEGPRQPYRRGDGMRLIGFDRLAQSWAASAYRPTAYSASPSLKCLAVTSLIPNALMNASDDSSSRPMISRANPFSNQHRRPGI